MPPRGQSKYQTELASPELENNQTNTWDGINQLISYLSWQKIMKSFPPHRMNPPNHLSIDIKLFFQEKKWFMWLVVFSHKYWDVIEIGCCIQNKEPGTHTQSVLIGGAQRDFINVICQLTSHDLLQAKCLLVWENERSINVRVRSLSSGLSLVTLGLFDLGLVISPLWASASSSIKWDNNPCSVWPSLNHYIVLMR